MMDIFFSALFFREMGKSVRIKVLVLWMICFFPLLCFAGGPSWFTSDDDNSQKWAIVPSYSHNSTYGHIFGARFFIYPTGNTGYYTSLESAVSKALFFSTNFYYKYWRENGDQLDLTADYDGFSEPYYGEGSRTKVEDQKDLPIHRIQARLEYVSRIYENLYGGAFIRFDHRKEKGGGTELFPWELLLSGGFLARYDFRDNYFNPTQGEYYQIQSWLLSRMPSPVFLEGDIRLFFSLMDGVVIALRGMVGLTFLNPSSYLFRFPLGGSNVLRGYRLNRFRGENYYLSQTELRYTPLKFLTLAGFFDFGSADDDLFLPPRYAFGGGLRFGLPPDYNKKIRVEFGIGLGVGEKQYDIDQYNIIVSFGHPF